ncbi:hypothetical protein LSTR_LSTR014694 [Laodelphax striatellus]|uniref:Uncharacterized protein n=1 Tax=Laodelphax striatellus TaxID=195883 RepID=A0A482WH32_LAOST|nr:hypothetical protein LSTR_LSTR014694 [Laodelphax striatellus]
MREHWRLLSRCTSRASCYAAAIPPRPLHVHWPQPNRLLPSMPFISSSKSWVDERVKESLLQNEKQLTMWTQHSTAHFCNHEKSCDVKIKRKKGEENGEDEKGGEKGEEEENEEKKEKEKKRRERREEKIEEKGEEEEEKGEDEKKKKDEKGEEGGKGVERRRKRR